jgi:hypothetical protein
VLDVPPGHDAWVVGDEPAETIAWTGVRGWLDRSNRSPIAKNRSVVSAAMGK